MREVMREFVEPSHKAPTPPLVQAFIDALNAARHLSPYSLSAYQTDVSHFARWLDSRGQSLLLAGQSDIEAYLAARSEEQFAASSNVRLLSTLRRFYQYLINQQLRDDDPSALIATPALLPSTPLALSEAEVEALLAAPRVHDALELRDKAMLEVLYATGIRVSELVALTLERVHLQQGWLLAGEGSKARRVPLGEEASFWLNHYVAQARGAFLGVDQLDVLFPSRRARQMTRQTFWHRIKFYCQRAGVRDDLSPHSLRHAFGLHLLHHGADVQVVQQLLGHASLSTTQIYSQILAARR
ncbi:MAG: site-specific tyrosine recombinase XerD [Aeromonas sp.]